MTASSPELKLLSFPEYLLLYDMRFCKVVVRDVSGLAILHLVLSLTMLHFDGFTESLQAVTNISL